MLVISSSSSCDVCLESYDSVTNIPCAISCGHVFCQKCLDQLERTSCPLCRVSFEPTETRRLHIDLGTPPRLAHTHVSSDSDEPHPPPPASVPPTQHEPRRLQSDIIRVVRDGVKSSELRRVLDECRTWYKTQPSDQYDGLRVSYLLLYHLTESRNKLSAETKKARAANAEFEEIKATLTKSLNDVTTQLEDLKRANEREKELARSVEESLREHHAALDARWKAQYDAAIHECRKLRSELGKARKPNMSYTPSEAEFYPSEDPDVTDDAEEWFRTECNFDRSLPTREDIIFGLSPLPENMPTLPSSMQPFAVDGGDDDEGGDTEDDDETDEDDLEKPHGKSSPVVYPLSHSFRTSATPISIPRAQVSPEDTAVDIDASSSWKSGLSKSRPQSRTYGRRHNSPVSSSPTDGSDARSKDQDATQHNVPGRDEHQQEKWRAQLYDLLDTPTPTPTPSSFSSDRFIEPLQRPGSTVSRSNTPATARQPSSSLGSRDAGAGFYDFYRPQSGALGYAKQMDKAQLDRREREKLRHTPSIPSGLKDGSDGGGAYGPTPGSYGSYREHRHSRSGKNKAHSVPNVSYA